MEARSALEHRLGAAKSASDSELRFNCPRCRHTDYRLYVNPTRVRIDSYTGRPRKGWFICFECQWRGPLIRLAQELGIEFWESIPDTAELRERLERVGPPQEAHSAPLQFPDAVPVLVNDLAADYMRSRDVSDLDILRSKAFLRTEDHYRRIYLPELDWEGEIRYCVSRGYLPNDPMPKYMSAGDRRGRGVYRLNEAEPGEDILICEGPFDALVQGENAVALYGTYLSNVQRDALLRVSDTFSIALDPDARTFASELAQTLKRHKCKVRVLRLPSGADPADLGREYIEHLKANTAWAGDSDLLRFRLT